jgi:hypothetical protein
MIPVEGVKPVSIEKALPGRAAREMIEERTRRWSTGC